MTRAGELRCTGSDTSVTPRLEARFWSGWTLPRASRVNCENMRWLLRGLRLCRISAEQANPGEFGVSAALISAVALEERCEQDIAGDCFRYNHIEATRASNPAKVTYFAYKVPAGTYV